MSEEQVLDKAQHRRKKEDRPVRTREPVRYGKEIRRRWYYCDETTDYIIEHVKEVCPRYDPSGEVYEKEYYEYYEVTSYDHREEDCDSETVKPGQEHWIVRMLE